MMTRQGRYFFGIMLTLYGAGILFTLAAYAMLGVPLSQPRVLFGGLVCFGAMLWGLILMRRNV